MNFPRLAHGLIRPLGALGLCAAACTSNPAVDASAPPTDVVDVATKAPDLTSPSDTAPPDVAPPDTGTMDAAL